jgi:hypothetical protein
MPETQSDEELGRKRKTTYPRDHPTDNPKPPKRTKAEIQQAAKEKKDAQLAKKVAAEAEKKKRLLDAEKKRKLSAQRIASVEDSVQRLQKACQSRSERPDLETMETYQKVQKQKEANTLPEEVDELDDDDDDMYTDPPQFPPESIIDTDSDGVRLGLFEPEGDDLSDSDGYKDHPSQDDDEDDDEDVEKEGDSEDSMVQINRNRKKQLEKKKKGSFGSLLLRLEKN